MSKPSKYAATAATYARPSARTVYASPYSETNPCAEIIFWDELMPTFDRVPSVLVSTLLASAKTHESLEILERGQAQRAWIDQYGVDAW